MAYTIKKVTAKTVEFDPPLATKNPTRVLTTEKFGVTDAAIALIEGNEFDKGVASYEITKFGPQIKADTGPVPAIDRNPYNFVAFADKQPWMTAKEPAGHDVFKELNGYLEFEAEALTPCFVPSGFPYSAGDPKPGGGEYSDDDLRAIPREFCTLLNAENQCRYAIPGASFKGALRSAVEALSNSRLGVADEEKKLDPKHLYRRRVFKCGILQSLPTGDWSVQEIEFPPDGYGSYATENKAGLLAWFRAGKADTRRYNSKIGTFRLSKDLAKEYSDTVREHAHYRKHFEDRNDRKEKYDELIDPLWVTKWREELADLRDGDVIFCVVDLRTGKVQNFGKNVNDLWPAIKSMADLVKPFLPRDAPDLSSATDMAEHLFGFVPKKNDLAEGEKGQAFRGLLRFETLWGPKPSEQASEEIALAPLTSPASQGKSRPLYLAPGANGLSASFDDASAEARGRKFYWHQRTGDGRIWMKHSFKGAGGGSMDEEFRKKVGRQCPAPIKVLPKGIQFRGRIHFSNLAPHELGTVLFALQGDGTYDHAFHLGKAKARGLGSFKIKVTKIEVSRILDRYKSLSQTMGQVDLTGKMSGVVEGFRVWCAVNAKHKGAAPSLHAYPHIQDFVRLHTWPETDSVRYYPPNFSQYSWLPGDDDARGEPNPPRKRPRAMGRARNITP